MTLQEGLGATGKYNLRRCWESHRSDFAKGESLRQAFLDKGKRVDVEGL